jgi:hypothetical protein
MPSLRDMLSVLTGVEVLRIVCDECVGALCPACRREAAALLATARRARHQVVSRAQDHVAEAGEDVDRLRKAREEQLDSVRDRLFFFFFFFVYHRVCVCVSWFPRGGRSCSQLWIP